MCLPHPKAYNDCLWKARRHYPEEMQLGQARQLLKHPFQDLDLLHKHFWSTCCMQNSKECVGTWNKTKENTCPGGATTGLYSVVSARWRQAHHGEAHSTAMKHFLPLVFHPLHSVLQHSMYCVTLPNCSICSRNSWKVEELVCLLYQ